MPTYPSKVKSDSTFFEKDLQEGHADVKTTEIYTHVLQQNLDKVVGPLDQL